MDWSVHIKYGKMVVLCVLCVCAQIQVQWKFSIRKHFHNGWNNVRNSLDIKYQGTAPNLTRNIQLSTVIHLLSISFIILTSKKYRWTESMNKTKLTASFKLHWKVAATSASNFWSFAFRNVHILIEKIHNTYRDE